MSTIDGQGMSYGQRVDTNSVLGKYFQMPARGSKHIALNLETIINVLPIYNVINLEEPVQLQRPSTPELVKRNRLHPNKPKKNV